MRPTDSAILCEFGSGRWKVLPPPVSAGTRVSLRACHDCDDYDIGDLLEPGQADSQGFIPATGAAARSRAR